MAAREQPRLVGRQDGRRLGGLLWALEALQFGATVCVDDPDRPGL
jgi:hypothetical protein